MTTEQTNNKECKIFNDETETIHVNHTETKLMLTWQNETFPIDDLINNYKKYKNLTEEIKEWLLELKDVPDKINNSMECYEMCDVTLKHRLEDLLKEVES